MTRSRPLAVLAVLVFLGVLGHARSGPEADPAVGRVVHYSGKVQGVGFRAAAVEIAHDYPVTGWVKNLDDGRVQLVVEGPAEAVEKFLKAVRTHWKDNITKEQVEPQEPTGKFKGFEIMR